ncbi:hypothetical protein TL16_g07580 [Triparma laevis f. inornata]|uniref:Uncharacterized protein n=1 Tax=Triparma laevis f. inornata TaxID=1714386 RepID=A0A9W7AYP7_9STRA|nr:hypothetical protein TL16_g07580 [Triparma laevis f. inornata]
MPQSGKSSGPSMNANVDFFVRSLSVQVRSHEEDPATFQKLGLPYTKDSALKRALLRESSILQLPLGFRSWVICALRKKAGELKYAFNTWKRKSGMKYMVEGERFEEILRRADDPKQNAPFSPINTHSSNAHSSNNNNAHSHLDFKHREEDLETLHQFVHQNKVPGNLFSKISALSSRSDLLNALNNLRLKTYKPNSIILLQNRPSPSPLLESTYTITKGSINTISLPPVMQVAESVKSIYSQVEDSNSPNPVVSVSHLNEWRMAGDEDILTCNVSFGETPADHHGEYLHEFFAITIGETSLITLDFKNFNHVNSTHGRAEELRQRITFLKNSKLFPHLSHAEVTDLAGKLKKETYAKNEIICQNAVANSETVTVYKVGKIAWEPFKPLMVQERLIGLLYKDKLKTEKPLVTLSKIVTLHNKFTSVRSIISQTRPHRGVVGLHEYNTAENSKKALLQLLEEAETVNPVSPNTRSRATPAGAGTPAFNRSPSQSQSSPTNRKRTRLRSQNSQVSMFSSGFDDDSAYSDSKMTKHPAGQPEHAKLDQHTVVHLGEAQRKALLLADEQRRAVRKEEAVMKNKGFRDRLISSFRKANEVNNKLQLQFVEQERREERQRLEKTIVEVHAALLLAKEGASAHNHEKVDPGAELKKVVGSILFGEESEDVAMTPAEKKRLKNNMSKLKNLHQMGTFGATTFKRKKEELMEKTKTKKKGWDKEQNRRQEIKDQREARISKVRSLINLCDDATSSKKDLASTAGDGDGKLSFAEEEQLMQKAKKLLLRVESVGDDLGTNAVGNNVEEKGEEEQEETKTAPAVDDHTVPQKPTTTTTEDTSKVMFAAIPKVSDPTTTSQAAPATDEPDPVKMVKAGAKKGWMNIKKVTTTHLDKNKESNSDGVKKMLMSTVRAVGTEDVEKKESEATLLAKLNSGEILDGTKSNLNIGKPKIHLSVPNTRYFKSTAKLEKRKNPFLDFDLVLSLSALNQQSETMDPSARLASGLKEFTNATQTMSPRDHENKRSLKDVTSVLASASDPLCGRTLNAVEEWQVYHVQKCMEYKETMKSLPNLNGIKGKCKTRSRENPKLIEM